MNDWEQESIKIYSCDMAWQPYIPTLFGGYMNRWTYYMPPIKQCSRMQELEMKVAPEEHAADEIAQVNTIVHNIKKMR